MLNFIETLRQSLTGGSMLLFEDDSGFQSAIQRWSTLGVEVPMAIVKSTSEADVITAMSRQQGNLFPSFAPSNEVSRPKSPRKLAYCSFQRVAAIARGLPLRMDSLLISSSIRTLSCIQMGPPLSNDVS